METTSLLIVAVLIPPAPISLVVMLLTRKALASVIAGALPTTLIAITWALGVSFRLLASGLPVGTDVGPRTPSEAFSMALVVSLTGLTLSGLSTLVARALGRGLRAMLPPQTGR